MLELTDYFESRENFHKIGGQLISESMLLFQLAMALPPCWLGYDPFRPRCRVDGGKWEYV